MGWRESFQILAMDPRAYIIKRAVPIGILALALAGAGAFVASQSLPAWSLFAIPAGVLLIAGAGIFLYPASMVDRKRMEIDNALPFFMTHFGVLSTSNMPRTEVFRILSEREEYKALALELKRIHGLVVDWKMALPGACRFASASPPSQIFGDFLERMAHAMETGQPLDKFLRGEQDVVMKEYATVYETSIYQVETWKDIYMSSMMSGAFLAIFALITPILTGASPQGLLIGTLGFILFMEVLLAFVLKMRTPADRLWHAVKIMTGERRRLRRHLLIGAGASIVIMPTLLLLGVGTGVSLAAGVTPLALGGWTAGKLEEKIKRREDNYAAFIRSLGAATAARGGSVREVLASVKTHNFGPLTGLVENLFARLTWRIDDNGAWKWFSAESGSHLIDAFTDMFIEGIKSGGDAARVGDIISDNVVRILNLRKARYSTAGTFRGTLYGLTASLAFVLFLGVGILASLGDIFAVTQEVSTADENLQAIAVNFDFDLDLIRDLVLTLLVLHGFMAAGMLKMVDGGAYTSGLLSLVILVWTAVGLASMSEYILPRAFDLGG